MPNWWECKLIIEGLREHVDGFLDLVRSEDSLFEFGKLVPYPQLYPLEDEGSAWFWKKFQESTGDTPTRFSKALYEWKVEHWGTRGDACDVTLNWTTDWECEEKKFRRVILYFDTVWSPPLGVIKRAAERFSDLVFDFKYWEDIGEWEGRRTYERGEMTRDQFESVESAAAENLPAPLELGNITLEDNQ